MSDSHNRELQAMQMSRFSRLYSVPARLISFVLAVSLYIFLYLRPHALGETAAQVNHGLLTLMLIGSSSGFVHASGLVPRARLWKFLFSPAIGWPLMTMGLWYLFSYG